MKNPKQLSELSFKAYSLALLDIHEDWKIKTETSNHLFDEGTFEYSLSGYQEALSLAELLNNSLIEAKRAGIPVVQIFIISCNNIAFTYEKMDKNIEGQKMLKRAIYFLLLQSNNKSLSITEIQSELKKAMLNYTEFVDRNDIEIKDIEKVFADIQEQFEVYENN